jgi:hypothetical protein
MKSRFRNRCLASVFALSAIVFQHGALAQSKQTSGDTVLVVWAGEGTVPKTNGANTNRHFLSFRDQLTVADAIVESENSLAFNPEVFKVEIVRGDQAIPLDIDMKQLAHHPAQPDAAYTILKRGDVMIVRPKVNYW